MDNLYDAENIDLLGKLLTFSLKFTFAALYKILPHAFVLQKNSFAKKCRNTKEGNLLTENLC